MQKFLEFDSGRKDHTVTCRVQYKLLDKLEEIAKSRNQSTSEYVRHTLIQKVRQEIENGYQKL